MKTYGTVQLLDGSWIVQAEPHVVLRMKRVFGGLSKKAHGKLKITDTLSTCRDLAWFIERYPLDVAPLEYLLRRSREHEESENLVASLLAGTVSTRAFSLSLPPREYQRIAAELALASKGVLIADDVGLGKTLVGIAMLTEPTTRPALVVTLTHLQRQWADEFKKFAPQLETHILKKSTPYDYTAIKNKRPNQLTLVKPHPDVLITNYHKLSGWADTLAPIVKSVLYDECHELRRGDASAKGSAALHLSQSTEYRCGLSATPIFNYGGEIYNVLEALRPGALGTYSEFTTEWCDGWGDKPRLKDPKAFGTYARDAGLMLRRTREEVGRELPELIKIPHHVDADKRALDAIDGPAAELARIILRESEEKLERGESFRAGGELEGLVRQATGIAKAPYVAEFVRMLVESGERVVLGGWHHAVYEIWLERLKDLKPAMYTGRESEPQKNAAKERFCKKETPILILSLRSGAGLDGLQYSDCRTVVYGELDWSPSVHEQFSGRVHRDGQKKSVLSYYLIADVGSDPIVADVLGVKKNQLDGLRDPTGATGVERLETTGDRVRKLAETFLKKKVRAA